MTRAVHVFVFNGFADWEPGFATAGINNPEHQRQPGQYAVATVSPDGRPVRSAGGLCIQPDLSLRDVGPEASAMLLLPGGPAWEHGGHTEAVELAAAFLYVGTPVAAICGATYALAEAGLLDTRAHTSNSRDYLAASGYAGAKKYRDVPAVEDRGLITASAMAPLEFAREIFACLKLYEPAVLQAWYGLFSTRRPEFYNALMTADKNRDASVA